MKFIFLGALVSINNVSFFLQPAQDKNWFHISKSRHYYEVVVQIQLLFKLHITMLLLFTNSSYH